MKTRGIFYAVFLVFLLSLSGIEGCPEKEEKIEGAYIGGGAGIGISFVEEEPPNEVLDNNLYAFYITLFVENMGEYVIPKGKIIATLSGISKEAFGIKSLSIRSKSDLFAMGRIGTVFIEGGLEEMRFDEANYKSDLPADFTTQLRVDVCYAYQTESLTKLCLKKNPMRGEDEDVCLITNEFIEVDNSGAPLHISNVKSVASGPDGVMFTFTVENIGIGSVYEDKAFTDICGVKQEKKNKVNVKVKSQSGKLNIKCGVLDNKDYGVVRLVNDRKTISCVVKTTGLQETAFEEPFEIVLNYFYKDSVSKSLTVMDAGY